MTILLVGLLLIIYSIIAKKYSVAIGMMLVLLIMGFQEGIPGDFMSYKETFMQGYVDVGLGSTAKETEFSYNWIVPICSRFMNFHWFVFLTSLIQCLAMGLMIKKYADKRYWSFGVLLVFFTYNLMLIQMKAMRQGYAVDCLLLAYWFIGNKRFLYAAVMAVIAYGFHNSALVAIPFFIVLYIISYIARNERINYEAPVNIERGSFAFASIITVGLILFTILKYSVIDAYVKPFAETLDFFEYGDYLEEMEDVGLAWWIVLYTAVSTFAVSLYYKSEKNFYKKYIALLSIVAGFVYVGLFGMGSLFRIGMFFDIFSIVTFPNVAAMLRNSYGKSVPLYYMVFNMVYLMFFSVTHMTSMSTVGGFGYGMYRFSFIN